MIDKACTTMDRTRTHRFADRSWTCTSLHDAGVDDSDCRDSSGELGAVCVVIEEIDCHAVIEVSDSAVCLFSVFTCVLVHCSESKHLVIQYNACVNINAESS